MRETISTGHKPVSEILAVAGEESLGLLNRKGLAQVGGQRSSLLD